MNTEYNESFTMICAASYFTKEATKYKLPEGMASKIAQIAGWLDELKQDIREVQ